MIRLVRGNLFESGAEALVNTVNCVGVMGKGIAYQFKRAYPAMHDDYLRKCKAGKVRLGEVTGFREGGKLIVNFPTKGHWRASSQIGDIRTGLAALQTFLIKENVRSVAMPPLGCGNGGLAWTEVRSAIEEELASLDLDVELYEPIGRFESSVAKEPRLSLGHFVLAALRTELDKPTKITFQKAAYFFNVFWGEQYFRFGAYRYGPYSVALDPMFNTIRDFLSHSGMSAQEMLRDGIARKLSGSNADRLKSMLPVVQSVARYCNARTERLEALATVHAIVSQQPGLAETELLDRFFSWSDEKAQRFTSDHVRAAVNELQLDGLIRKTLLGYEPMKQGARQSAPSIEANKQAS
jgi:O-acetyl-ADP-ribose deacetylase (regulator of RNase III)